MRNWSTQRQATKKMLNRIKVLLGFKSSLEANVSEQELEELKEEVTYDEP